MTAEIIAVGSELLTPAKIDTNSLYLTEQLNSLGIEVRAKTIVGDDREWLAAVIQQSLLRVRVVLLTGGLGPTEDDVTRDAVARVLNRTQTLHPEALEAIRQRFSRMGRQMSENNQRQAMIIDGAEMLPNDRGTAPGQFVLADNVAIFLLPGPPREMKAMFEQQVLPRLQRMVPPLVIRTRFYRVSGMPESDLDQLIAPVYTAYENPVTTILAAPGDIQIHLRARTKTEEEAEALLAEVGGKVEPLIGENLYSRNGDPMEAIVGQLLKHRQATLVCAESCTGGLIAQRLTSVPGSSQYFLGSFVTYTEEMKANILNVDRELLETHGAVSEACAEAMACGARRHSGSTYALSITGFAGPDGGTEKDPVGTVYIGIAEDAACVVHRFRFMGDRDRVRALAAQTALDLLRKKLLAP